MSRHPRAVQELLEVETVILITGPDALLRLTRDCRFPEPKARRVLNIAWEFGQKAEPCPGGYVHVWYHGKDDRDNHIFSVVEHIGNPQERKVADGPDKDYTQRKTMPRRSGKAAKEATKGTAMAPRKPRTAPEPETASQNGDAVDFAKFVAKDLTPKMVDYVTWFEANVAGLDTLEVDRILALGVSMYKYFQTSEFNAEQTEARRAEREAATEAAPEPEVAAPARSGRTRSTAKPTAAKPATAKPATRAAAAPKPAGRATTKARTRATAPAGDSPF